MSAWRPIETAPKDGTRVLAHGFAYPELRDGKGQWITSAVGADRVPFVMIVYWHEIWYDKEIEIGDGAYRKERVLSDVCGWWPEPMAFTPTHWQPLPEPPGGNRMTDIPSLVSRLEAASGPDRDLDFDLWRAFTDTHGVPSDVAWRIAGEPRLTTSIDAVTSLIARALPGWTFGVNGPDPELGNACIAEVWRGKQRAEGERAEGELPTPALALCLALVRAKAAMMEQGE